MAEVGKGGGREDCGQARPVDADSLMLYLERGNKKELACTLCVVPGSERGGGGEGETFNFGHIQNLVEHQ